MRDSSSNTTSTSFAEAPRIVRALESFAMMTMEGRPDQEKTFPATRPQIFVAAMRWRW